MKSSVGRLLEPSVSATPTEIAGLLPKPLRKEIITRSRRTLQWQLLILGLVALDVLVAAAAFRLAFFIRFELSLSIFDETGQADLYYYRLLVGLFLILMLGIFFIKGVYNRENLLGGTREYALLFDSATIWALLIITFSFFQRGLVLARGWLLIAWLLMFVMVAAGRFLARRVVYWVRQYGYFLTPALIVGANDEGISLANQLKQWKTSGFWVLGFIDNKFSPGVHVTGDLHSLGRVSQLNEIMDHYQVGELILATSSFSTRDHMIEIFRRYGTNNDIKVRFSSGLYEIITTGLTVQDFAYVPLVGINPVRMTGMDQFLKALLDYSAVILGMIVALPVMLLVALAVRLDSPGPVIYRRRVMGVRGKQFDAFKFRTMRVNGDEMLQQYPHLQAELAANHKLKDDPRITRVGGVLRKFSLDELPQLFNVLRGEMSLVGPRMISPEEMSKYERWDMNLLTVRPGITGLWQVSGRSDVSYEERVRMDMRYIRNWTIWLDIQILIQTFPAVIKSRGAY